ncbi:MAG: neutral peptidase [Hyphomicrobiales bacterium]|jgi:Zn-dependent metalloprotease|nr:neutral peptidase [Hyphomicrobiales bacterium]
MAKKAKKAKAAKKTARSTAKSGAFKSLAMHVTESKGRSTFEALRAERPTSAAFGFAASQPADLDPESAAKRILEHALESKAAPTFTAPTVSGTESDFKSLGVETVPLTGTNVVKFRQTLRGIPVYGSLVSVELDDANEMVSLNSNIATPDVASYVAKISPQDALKRVASEAGYGRELPQVTPVLNLYLDAKNKWHLAYIAENVRSRKKEKAPSHGHGHGVPIMYDYVVDALTGGLVAELPRTPSMADGTDTAIDELGKSQTFAIDVAGTKKTMRNAQLNIETFDFRFRDPEVLAASLPGTLNTTPWTKAAVSAHVNAATVATFLRDVLKRNNIDNMGGKLISTVNCVLKRDERPVGSKNWLNAFWDGTQMVYGQVTFNGVLRSLASSLDVVAHELFHGVTERTARLVYQAESGALNESYSDIFGVIVSNLSEPDIAKWNWLIGDAISSSLAALRDMEDPTRFNQPKLMKNFRVLPNTPAGDNGGVHINSGIHNFAAFKVMTAKSGANFLFKPAELAAMFYVALTQQLSRQSGFADSRRGVVLATRSLFRTLPQAQIDARVRAVEAGFTAAGIT